MIDDTGYNENEYDANGTDPMASNGTEGMEGTENMPTDALDQPTEEEQPAEKKKTPRPKGIGKYIFLALLFALLSLGGLVIGFLGSFLEIFKHPLLHGTSKIDATILGTFINLLSNFGEIFGELSKAFQISISEGIVYCVELLSIILPVVFALISLIMFIVAAATKKLERARTCAYASGILTLLAYGTLFLYTFATFGLLTSLAGGDTRTLKDIIDYSCLIIAGVSFITLFIASCVRSKKVGFLNSLALLFLIVCALCIYYPGTITSVPALIAFDLAKGSMLFFGIAFPALIVILLLNLIITSARLNAQRGLMFDAIRYGLQLLALILTVIATICYPFDGDRWVMFKGTQLIVTIILLVLTIACLFIPMFTLIYRAIKRRGEKQAAEQQFQGETAEDPSYSNYDYNGYDNNYDNGYQDEQPAAEAQEQPQEDYAQPQPENNYQGFNPYQQPAPEYNYQPQPEPDNVVVTIDTEDLQNFFNMQPEPQPEPETLRYQAPEPEPEMLNTHEPVVIKEVIREVIKEKEPEPAPKPELTEFERRMAALAKANDAPKEPEQQERPQQRPRPNPQQNGFRQGANQRPNQQNNPFMRNRHNNEQGNNPNVPAFAGNRQPNSYVFGGSQYTYDPFINTLTPMEKNEFGDVFIANLYGIHSYLPTYIIGGDNTEFFQTIFIHLGRFRGNISRELMEKIYAYVNKSSS
ncbi:MAG: hypothetical protein K2N84_03995 [Clostridia bacterium]|nr:hypothetical protein [Clostridia bacterium]